MEIKLHEIPGDELVIKGIDLDGARGLVNRLCAGVVIFEVAGDSGFSYWALLSGERMLSMPFACFWESTLTVELEHYREQEHIYDISGEGDG